MNRITWGAVIMHALAGFGASAVAAGLSMAAGLTPWPFALALTLASFAFWTWREIVTAASRNGTDFAGGVKLVLEGEGAPWSPWNLRLQALAPLVGGLLVTAYVATGL